jgi:hypothetical protein
MQYDYVELSRDVKPVEDEGYSQHSEEGNVYMPGQAYMPEEHPEKSHESTRPLEPLRFVDH